MPAGNGKRIAYEIPRAGVTRTIHLTPANIKQIQNHFKKLEKKELPPIEFRYIDIFTDENGKLHKYKVTIDQNLEARRADAIRDDESISMPGIINFDFPVPPQTTPEQPPAPTHVELTSETEEPVTEEIPEYHPYSHIRSIIHHDYSILTQRVKQFGEEFHEIHGKREVIPDDAEVAPGMSYSDLLKMREEYKRHAEADEYVLEWAGNKVTFAVQKPHRITKTIGRGYRTLDVRDIHVYPHQPIKEGATLDALVLTLAKLLENYSAKENVPNRVLLHMHNPELAISQFEDRVYNTRVILDLVGEYKEIYTALKKQKGPKVVLSDGQPALRGVLNERLSELENEIEVLAGQEVKIKRFKPRKSKPIMRREVWGLSASATTTVAGGAVTGVGYNMIKTNAVLNTRYKWYSQLGVNAPAAETAAHNSYMLGTQLLGYGPIITLFSLPALAYFGAKKIKKILNKKARGVECGWAQSPEEWAYLIDKDGEIERTPEWQTRPHERLVEFGRPGLELPPVIEYSDLVPKRDVPKILK